MELAMMDDQVLCRLMRPCRRELAEREIKVEKSDFNIDNMLTTMRQYYRDGRYVP